MCVLYDKIRQRQGEEEGKKKGKKVELKKEQFIE